MPNDPNIPSPFSTAECAALAARVARLSPEAPLPPFLVVGRTMSIRMVLARLLATVADREQRWLEDRQP